jgi:hypothetical protein
MGEKAVDAMLYRRPPDEKPFLDNRKPINRFIRGRWAVCRVILIAPITLKSPENVGSI